LTEIFRLELRGFQLNSDHALQQPVVEQKVGLEGLASYLETMFFVDEKKILAHLQYKILHVLDYGFAEFVFLVPQW